MPFTPGDRGTNEVEEGRRERKPAKPLPPTTSQAADSGQQSGLARSSGLISYKLEVKEMRNGSPGTRLACYFLW